MYTDRFIALKLLLAIIGTVAICGFLYSITFAPQTRVETQVSEPPPLSASSKIAEVSGRFESAPSQSVPTEQLGMPEGGTCDAYPLQDGLVLLCHA